MPRQFFVAAVSDIESALIGTGGVRAVDAARTPRSGYLPNSACVEGASSGSQVNPYQVWEKLAMVPSLCRAETILETSAMKDAGSSDPPRSIAGARYSK